MRSFYKTCGRICILAVPLVMGMIGFFLVQGEEFLQALFNSVCLYF